MELLTNVNQYYALLNTVKAAYKVAGPMYTNCYFTADSVERYVSERRLYSVLLSNGLLFLQNQGNFYKLQMWLVKIAPFDIPKLEKPLVAELVFRLDKPVNEQVKVEKLLTSVGMQLYREMKEITIGSVPPEKKDQYDQKLEYLKQRGFRFEPVARQAAPAVYELLRRNIDKYDLYGFKEMNWPWICKNEFAFCVYTPQGDICAVCVVPRGFRGGLSAVDLPYRGQGIGQTLEYYSYHMQNKARVTDHLWIALDNSVNLHLMQVMGGKDSFRRTRSYIMDHQSAKETKA